MHHELRSLDPTDPSDVEAIRAVLRQRRQAFPPELRAFAGRVQEEAADPELRLDAKNALASAAVVSGDDDEGSRLFRQVLERTWGAGTHVERVACVNLAMILARQRRLVEAFALSRRACRLAMDTAEPLGICLAHAQLAKMLVELGDHDGFREAVDTAVRHCPELDETLAGWVPHLLAGLRAEVALQQGDLAAAERFMTEALDHPDVIAEVVDMMRVQFLRRAGRPAEALSVVREALLAGPTEPSYRLRFQGEWLMCLVDLDDLPALHRRASACLAEMAKEGRRCGSPTWRMRVGEAVGAALAKSAGHGGEARRAFEIAAVAALERSWESKLFFQEFPQLEDMEAEDVAVLQAHGERFRSEHLELLAAMRTLLRDGVRYDAFADTRGEQFFVSVCAWCNHVRGPDRVWVPLDSFAAPETDLEVTHGICTACAESLRADSPAASPASASVPAH